MQSSALLKARIEAFLGAPHLTWRARPAPELLPTGIPGLELPRGAISDVYGPPCSGRTSLLTAALAEATARQEVCALIDATDSFEPASAAAAGSDLDRILWVRCGGRPDKALKIADLIIQAGGFGLVALDLAGIAPAVARRIPLASWYRFRRAIENTPAAMLIIEREPTAKAAASLVIEMRRGGVEWSGAPDCSRLLRGLRIEAVPRKPAARESVRFDARASA